MEHTDVMVQVRMAIWQRKLQQCCSRLLVEIRDTLFEPWPPLPRSLRQPKICAWDLRSRTRLVKQGKGLAAAILLGVSIYYFILIRMFIQTSFGPGTLIPGGSYEVVISTYRRDSSLERNLWTLGSCSKVHRVHVVWNDISRPIPENMQRSFDVQVFNASKGETAATKRLTNARIVFHADREDDLNNRFQDRGQLFQREALFSMDDDMEFSCRDLDTAYAAWVQHGAGPAVVGFYPRRLRWTTISKDEGNWIDVLRTVVSGVQYCLLWDWWEPVRADSVCTHTKWVNSKFRIS
eukprot:m.633625 g.633625  ORF g.633625 m.633625 type:complete len:293 (+) comp22580_c0_seq67:164-1042(+)